MPLLGRLNRVQRLIANRDYAITLSVNVITYGLGIVTSIILARWLGPTGRGEVAATLLWPPLLMYIGSLGMIEAIMYFTAQADTAPGKLFAASNFLVIGQTIVMVSLGFYAVPFLLASQNTEVIQLSRLYLIVIPIGLAAQYYLSILRGNLKVVAYNCVQLLIPSGYFLGTILLRIQGGLSTENIVMLQLFLNFLVLLFAFFLLLVYRVPLGLIPDFALLGVMIRYGLAVHVGTVFSSANLRLDQVLLSAWTSSDRLGLYVTAVSTANLTGILAKAVYMVASPVVARIVDFELRVIRLKVIFEKYWLSSMFLKSVLAVIIPYALPLVFGDAYRDAIITAEILVLASLFLDAKLVLTGGAYALGTPWIASRAEFVSSILTLVLLLVLLPSLGLVGAAMTSVLAYAMGLIVIVQGLRRQHGLRLIWRPIIVR